jgi:hypothetical protein
MSHLVIHMLAKAYLVHITADSLQEAVNSCEEVALGFIVEDTRFHGLADSHDFDIGVAGQLSVPI